MRSRRSGPTLSCWMHGEVVLGKTECPYLAGMGAGVVALHASSAVSFNAACMPGHVTRGDQLHPTSPNCCRATCRRAAALAATAWQHPEQRQQRQQLEVLWPLLLGEQPRAHAMELCGLHELAGHKMSCAWHALQAAMGDLFRPCFSYTTTYRRYAAATGQAETAGCAAALGRTPGRGSAQPTAAGAAGQEADWRPGH